MDLFRDGVDNPDNFLPQDGQAKYYGVFIPIFDADYYLSYLLAHVSWKNDEAVIFGKHLSTQRKVAWYGDKSYEYTYSKTTKSALPWTKELLALKNLTEERLQTRFNACLLNLYHSGQEGMSWHSDSERELKKNGTIASLSFGAERKFSFKHKTTKESYSLTLEHGSLLTMQGETQSHWLHQLPKTTKVIHPRVNLTFRTIELQKQSLARPKKGQFVRT